MSITCPRRVRGVSAAPCYTTDPHEKPEIAVILSCGHTVEAPDGPLPLEMNCRICAAGTKAESENSAPKSENSEGD